MSKIIAIVNQKGGVGKTTTCVNLAAAVKAKGKRVLLCDFDPQANATSGMGVDKSVSNGVYDVLINGTETAKAIVSTPYGDVLPSSKALAGAGVAAGTGAPALGFLDSPRATYPPASTASTPAAPATLTHGLRGSGLINRPSSLAKLHPMHGRRDAGSPPPVSAMAHGHATGRAAYADGVAHAIHRHAAPIR